MSYLKEFQREIQGRNLDRFMVLWEEYCTNDTAAVSEIIALLKMIKGSELAPKIGPYIETLIPLIRTISDIESRWAVYKLLFDIQTTNTDELFEIATEEVNLRFGSHPQFTDLLLRAGLRAKGQFQGALSQMELLAHFKKGNYVLHTGAFGVGEIMELSYVRESLMIEFEKAQGVKSIPFATALKSLEPLPESHFLVQRFSFADTLEKRAKESPVELMRQLLTDLGPKTAQEIRDELAGYIIEEDQWSRFWQNVRGKIKKDLSFESPDDPKGLYQLRHVATSHREEFLRTLAKKRTAKEALAAVHSFCREHPNEVNGLREQIQFEIEKWAAKDPFQTSLMKQELFSIPLKEDPIFSVFLNNPHVMIEALDILFYKKAALEIARKEIPNWEKLFLDTLLLPQGALLRDYLIKELVGSEAGKIALYEFLVELAHYPMKAPDLFFYCFNKIVIEDKEIVSSEDLLEKEKWWEGLLVLLNQAEKAPQLTDIAKKIVQLITHERYRYVRNLFKEGSYEFVREFLLLASKCHFLTERDKANLRSLAAVHYADLGSSMEEKNRKEGSDIFWATDKGYLKIEARMKEIAEKEIIDNSREIETARAHGDLRENADYKFAKERRSRLQGELRRLSQEFQKARVITPNDVSSDVVGIGSIIEAVSDQGKPRKITLLGPWEADPDIDVFSTQSKVAESLMGKKVGEDFLLQNVRYIIKKLTTILDL